MIAVHQLSGLDRIHHCGAPPVSKPTDRYPLVPAFSLPPVRAVPIAAVMGCFPLVPGMATSGSVISPTLSKAWCTFSVANLTIVDGSSA